MNPRKCFKSKCWNRKLKGRVFCQVINIGEELLLGVEKPRKREGGTMMSFGRATRGCNPNGVAFRVQACPVSSPRP